ncbi:MAG: hypothetical protein JETT_2982 [Candidatus Jettenia ecosi]|uniref:Uncharacterized protein n=1 Tax=Candidatus Jettenia ecosi TaxID=2494326 RepID=A0A533Q7X1_9BACT|nr:MAG: hypothetical protein JETT_2982 [Candidatus Jettenia ecosi]
MPFQIHPLSLFLKFKNKKATRSQPVALIITNNIEYENMFFTMQPNHM